MNYSWTLTDPTPTGKTYWIKDVHIVSRNDQGLLKPNFHRTIKTNTKNPLDFFDEHRHRMLINPSSDTSDLNLYGLQHLIYFLDHPDAYTADQAAFNMKYYLDPERGLPLLDELMSTTEWRHLSPLHADINKHLTTRSLLWVPNRKMTAAEWEHYVGTYTQALEKGSRRQAEFHEELLCLTHFTRFFAFSGWQEKYGYFACRICLSSVNSIRVPNVIAVIDPQMDSLHETTKNAIRINALKYDRLFDFDEVEIHPCTEDDIEHFCILVGNDADAYRMSHYHRVKFTLSSGMSLTEESKRDLSRVFPISL